MNYYILRMKTWHDVPFTVLQSTHPEPEPEPELGPDPEEKLLFLSNGVRMRKRREGSRRQREEILCLTTGSARLYSSDASVLVDCPSQLMCISDIYYVNRQI